MMQRLMIFKGVRMKHDKSFSQYFKIHSSAEADRDVRQTTV